MKSRNKHLETLETRTLLDATAGTIDFAEFCNNSANSEYQECQTLNQIEKSDLANCTAECAKDLECFDRYCKRLTEKSDQNPVIVSNGLKQESKDLYEATDRQTPQYNDQMALAEQNEELLALETNKQPLETRYNNSQQRTQENVVKLNQVVENNLEEARQFIQKAILLKINKPDLEKQKLDTHNRLMVENENYRELQNAIIIARNSNAELEEKIQKSDELNEWLEARLNAISNEADLSGFHP